MQCWSFLRLLRAYCYSSCDRVACDFGACEMSEVLSFVGKARSALPSRFPLVMMVAGLRVVVHCGRQTLPRLYACVK